MVQRRWAAAQACSRAPMQVCNGLFWEQAATGRCVPYGEETTVLSCEAYTSSRLGRCTAICHAPATRLLRKPPQTAMERLVSHVHTSIFAQVDAHGQNNGGLVSDFCFVLLQSRAFGADMGLLAQGGGSHCSPGRRVLLKKMTAHVKNKPCILQC